MKSSAELDVVEEYLAANQLAEAKELCTKLCGVNPSYAEAFFCMSRILVAQEDATAAIDFAQKAARLKPDWFDAWMMVSGLAGMLQDLEQSEHAARKAVQLKSSDPGGYINLGHALSGKQDIQNAILCYRAALSLNPSLERVRYRIASLGGDTAPLRAPDQYVAGLFDSYAKKFEAHLIDKLAYKTPARIMDVIAYCEQLPLGQLNVLDLGCGTGLCGELLHEIAHQLVGVDLSSGMLQEARNKAIYNELVEQEVVAYLRGCDQFFDVIAAADLLVYLGDLSELFVAVRPVLAKNGVFVFSIELTSAERSYELQETGRYKHAIDYIRELAKQNGFVVFKEERVVLREEAQIPVEGFIVALYRDS